METNRSFVICEQLKKSLTIFQQTNVISNDVLKQIIDVSIKNILAEHTSPNMGSIMPSKPDLFKELHAALTNFFIQIARHGFNKEQIDEYCTGTLKMHSLYSNIIAEYYLKYENELRSKLSSISTLNEALLVGIDWKLDYIIKTSEVSSVNSGPLYRIRLNTMQFNSDTLKNEQKVVEFNCDIIELSDLVSKLKDITHQIERIAYSNVN